MVRICQVARDGWIVRVGGEVKEIPNRPRAAQKAKNCQGVLSSHIDLAVSHGGDGELYTVGEQVSSAGGLSAIISFVRQVRRIKSRQNGRAAVLQSPYYAIACTRGGDAGSSARKTEPA